MPPDMHPDISVVIPTYNRAQPLREALESVLAQSHTSLEVIVVDDSPDQTARSVASEYDDRRIRYFPMAVPSGGFPSRVRNFGAERAGGRFVHFLDDDDHAPAGLYDDVVRAFQNNGDVGVLFGRVEPFGTDAAIVATEKNFFDGAARAARRLQWFGKRWPVATRMLFFRTVLVCGAALVRRECVAGIGGFDPDIRYGEDAGFYARAIRKYGGRFVDRPFLHYRIWEHSIAHASNLPVKAFGNDFVKMQTRYRLEAGTVDYALSKIAARTVLRLM